MPGNGSYIIYGLSHPRIFFFIFLSFYLYPCYPWSSHPFHGSLTPRASSGSHHPHRIHFLRQAVNPIHPAFKAMVRTQLFSGTISEDPGDHLRVFEGLCSSLVIPGMTQEAVRWKLFPFSLTEREEQWYTRMIGSMCGNWKEL